MALVDPLGDHFANPTRRLDANGIETRRHEEPGQGGRLAQNVIVIGCE